MAVVKQSALVSYSATQMYQLVNNYQDYPQFVPGCVASRTILQQENLLVGELTISKAGIQQSFTTRNTLIENKSIKMQLESGPFKYLQGEWRFEPLDEKSCQIQLELDFEFSNPLISFAFGQIFTHLTSKMIDAFKQRAKQIYGTN